ncbi:MAG: lactate racemase domain-containing protein [Pirellulales bacterium]
MPSMLRFGSQRTIDIDLPSGVLLAEFRSPPARPIDDPAVAVMAALGAPVDFPPLARAVVPGDQVAIALAEAVPCASETVAGTVATLIEGGIRPVDITVVAATRDGSVPAPDPRRDLPASVAAEVDLVPHDPSDRRQLGFLATSAANRPIYFNRTLYDADVVVPIGSLFPPLSDDTQGAYADLYPLFSDTETIDRFRERSTGRRRQQLRQETDEMGWLSGVTMAVRVLPGPDDRVLDVLAGAIDAVHTTGESRCREAWSFSIPSRASLVVASLEGGSSQQTWDNVARCLAAASIAALDGGAIVICTDLVAPPGKVLTSLSDADDLQVTLGHLGRDRSPHAHVATELARVLSRAHVYLLSQLGDATVEQMGMTPVADATQLRRLAQQHDSCIVIGHAQYAIPTLGQA